MPVIDNAGNRMPVIEVTWNNEVVVKEDCGCVYRNILPYFNHTFSCKLLFKASFAKFLMISEIWQELL